MYENTSTESSPSPISPFSQLHSVNYDLLSGSAQGYQSYTGYPNEPTVEFTDLTTPYNEDRRRRRPHTTKDKQSLSSMHMRRRAQNRASQRAFRDRKEKHAQDLQRQLDELEKKHQELLTSYHELGTTNTKLTTEIHELRTKMSTLHSSRNATLDEMMASEIFNPFEFDHNLRDDAKLVNDS